MTQLDTLSQPSPMLSVRRWAASCWSVAGAGRRLVLPVDLPRFRRHGARVAGDGAEGRGTHVSAARLPGTRVRLCHNPWAGALRGAEPNKLLGDELFTATLNENAVDEIQVFDHVVVFLRKHFLAGDGDVVV